MRTLDSKIAIVTGAARGIGREIALTLARERATVVVVDVDIRGGEDTAGIARETSLHSEFYALDITDPSRVELFVQEIAQRHGTIDILVNNAGVTRQTDFFAVSPEEIDWIFDVNVKGSFFMMQATAKVMKAMGEGRIVNISSIAGKGYRNTSSIAYAGSKGAMLAMTRVAAAALGPYGITVNAICPGLTETEMLSDWLVKRAADAQISVDAARKERISDAALRRVNSVSDVALSVLFMVSPASRAITGQSLNVDGGVVWD
jgi:NAD(P)-dependent dehydrogenase (short-subunit alcohol dehydrogenase family)